MLVSEIFIVLEYEQDSTKDETFKFNNSHPVFTEESKVWEYIESNGIQGKIAVYDKEEYQLYITDCIDDIDVLRWVEW